MAAKASGRSFTTWRPWVYHCKSPIRTELVPSVAMKAWMRMYATRSALTSPTARPTARTARQASGQGRPCCIWSPMARICESPMVPATERSNRLAASGIITASAASAWIDRLLASEVKVKAVGKVSGRSGEKTTTSTTSGSGSPQTETSLTAPSNALTPPPRSRRLRPRSRSGAPR